MRSNIAPLLCVFTILFCAALPGCASAREKVCLRNACYLVDIARTPAEREKGLMFRQALAKGEGMLFVFEQEAVYPFWMKNMAFAIDMIWLDKDKRVADIAPAAEPCSKDPCFVYTPSAKAMYVLEVPAGDAAAYGITAGDVLN